MLKDVVQNELEDAPGDLQEAKDDIDKFTSAIFVEPLPSLTDVEDVIFTRYSERVFPDYLPEDVSVGMEIDQYGSNLA